MLKYANANEMLMTEFKETRAVFDEGEACLKDFYKDIPHCFYEDALVPYVMKLLRENRNDELKKAFSFIEKLFSEGDEDFVDLAGVCIVEPIYYEPDYEEHREKIYSLCGDLTRQSFDDMDADDSSGTGCLISAAV